jgi:hypothetical protein
VRADLLALTPEAVAALANLGLVKRAQRELAEGAGPALSEEPDGTVTGRFADGVVAKLSPGKTLKESPCSCNAVTTCRHRVAVALAYRPWHEAEHAGAPARVDEAWSPADIDDGALERALGAKLLARARAQLARGVLVTLEPASPPTARLPTCTVRFLVPRDVAYARCDCAEEGACEHLALAVWAFRQGKAQGVVALGGVALGEGERAVLERALALARDIVAAGVVRAIPPAARFAEAREASAALGTVWITSLLSDLEQTLEAYHARSAIYGAHDVHELVVELAARARAAHAAQAELPARYVLGEDEAPETRLDHVRLISLGARLLADGRTRHAEIFLADPDTAMVLVLRKRWDDVDDVGPALARRSVAAKISLAQLACGQLVSKAVKRRANHSIEISGSRTQQSSVTPQRGDWDALPAPILVRDIAAHLAAVRARPPKMLRPRVLAENVHVLAVREVSDVVYVPAEQTVVALLQDAEGNVVRATVTHRAVAPHALDAAAAALSGKVRFVSGELGRAPDSGEPHLELLAIAGDGLVVPDVAAAVAAPTLSRASVQRAADPVEESIGSAVGLLDEALQHGLSSAPRDRLRAAAARLDEVGLGALAARVARLAESPSPAACIDAALWAALLHE